MLTTLIKKEILDSFFSYRFLFGTLLCMVVIPLGVYVSLKEYQRQESEYDELQNYYREQTGGKVGSNYTFEGYRPPSVLSIFAFGLESMLPNKVSTSQAAGYRMERETGIENPDSLLFGRMDLLFNVGFVISLLGFILTFSSISGEKEGATLRLMLSNPVPRWNIIASKIVGAYAVLLLPFILSFTAGLIIVNASGVSSILAPAFSLPLVVLFLVTLLFLLSMCTLGILCSSLTHRTRTSIVMLLLVWTFTILAWPKISPMISGIIHPVKSREVHNFERMLARTNCEKELENESKKLFDKIIIDGFGLDMFKVFAPTTERERAAQAAYDTARGELVKKYDVLIAKELGDLDKSYSAGLASQSAIARNLSRLSPLCCYTYIATDIAGTGMLEMNNFIANSERFQGEANDGVYSKIIQHFYGGTKTEEGVFDSYVGGFDPEKAPIPQLTYSHKTLNEALSGVWGDILLLVLYSLVFFTLSYVSFIRYDVR